MQSQKAIIRRVEVNYDQEPLTRSEILAFTVEVSRDRVFLLGLFIEKVTPYHLNKSK